MNCTSFTWVADPLLYKINGSWKELLFNGCHRLDKKFAEQAIRYIYRNCQLPTPAIIHTDGPLEYLFALMEQDHRMAPGGKRQREMAWFDRYLEKTVSYWEQQIRNRVEDFKFVDPSVQLSYAPKDAKLPVYRLLKQDILPGLQQALEDTLFHGGKSIGEACYTVLRKTIGFKTAVPFHQDALKVWTGSKMRRPHFLDRFRGKTRTEMLWHWLLDDYRALLPLMPLFDYFRHRKVLKDESFMQIAKLYQSGIFAMACWKDCCITCSMPVAVSEERGVIHAGRIPATGFKDGLQLFFDHGIHYPAEWLQKPDAINLELSCDSLSPKEFDLMERLVGAPQLIPRLIPHHNVCLPLTAHRLKIGRTCKEPRYINRPVLYLYLEDEKGKVIKARKITSDKARTSSKIIKHLLEQKVVYEFDELPPALKKLL